MKYYKLEYDMNRPSVKGISVPTDSDYGVAVKVYRNNQLLTGDISVGGLSATEGSGNWKLVELESGSTATTGKLDVDFHKPSTLEGDFTGEVSAKNTRSQPQQKAFTLPLSDFLDKDLTITPRDINLELLQKRTAGIDEEYGDFADTSTQYAKVNSLLTFTGTSYSTNLYCSLGTPAGTGYTPYSWKYFKTGEGNVTDYDAKTIPYTTGKIQLDSSYLNANTKAEIKYRLTINTHDGVNGKFTLLVQQSDKGYIEVKKEEPVEQESEAAVE
jgi:hypothetical protein